MELPSYFKDFLTEIRLTPNQLQDLITGHKTLRKRLKEDDNLSKIIVSTFLQGSYSRFTAVRPKRGKRSDVDVIVVTKLDKDEYDPEDALNLFVPFLEKHYPGNYRIQGRSIGICLSYVDLDLVVTAAPSESEEGLLKKMEELFELSSEDIILEDKDLIKSNLDETFALKQDSPQWKSEPLYIPDREVNKWQETHPLEQIRWTLKKNKITDGHYVNVVKALKWWRKEKYPDSGHPKSYPLEHFIGDCCPDDITSVACGITLTLEKIVSNYKKKPFLKDRGVPDHDVFGRLSPEEYDEFYSQVCDAAIIARNALNSENIIESAIKWKELFGNKFPDPPQNSQNSSYQERTRKSETSKKGRFA